MYGYISIPNSYCIDFIDTEIFQRLRRIEQTSMRVLYPTAHHDRFAHSIGVYYLGELAFQHIHENSKNFFDPKIISDEDWLVFKNTFLIASLMHDCGHSPFSHTFEHFYLYKKEEEIKNKISEYFIDEPSFAEDYNRAAPASHEKISALILLSKYSNAINRNNAEPLLAARMIMGCKYTTSKDLKSKFKNKLISLLNGNGIDVDSLDYIQRDSWASGVSNVNIDYHRLFTSIMIKPDDNGKPQIVFRKHVLSVLENINLGRNFLYKWIYSHHKVTYEQNLLSSIVDKINKDSNDEFCNKAFSIETFIEPQKFQNLSFYLPTDDDIIYAIKQFYYTDTKIQELLSRKHSYKALWKTYFEFKHAHFNNVGNPGVMEIFSKVNKGALSDLYGNEILCLPAKPKLKGINQNDFFIEIDNKLIDASKSSSLPSENLSYFLLYVSDKLLGEKENIIKNIIDLQS